MAPTQPAVSTIAPSASGHQYTPEEIAYLQALNQPQAQPENNELAQFFQWANDNNVVSNRTDAKGNFIFVKGDGSEVVGRLPNGMTPYDNAEAQRAGLLT
jgi:hypothetical protein